MYSNAYRYVVVGASIAVFLSACTTRPTPAVTPPTATVVMTPTRVATTKPSPAATAISIPPSPVPTSTPSHALRDLMPDEALTLVAEFPTYYSNYGVRMAFSPTQPILYHNGAALSIEGFDFEAGEVVFQLPGFTGYSPFLVIVSDDDRLLAAENGTELGIWELATGEKLATLRITEVFSPFYAGFLGLNAFWAADYTGNVALWETTHWQEIARLDHWGNFDAVSVLPNFEAVAMLDRRNNELLIVDWKNEPLRSVPIGAQWSQLLAVSPKGHRALVHVDLGLYTEGVQLVNLETAEVSAFWPTQRAEVFAVSADWRLLAIAQRNGQVRFADPETLEELYAQKLESLQIRGLAISPDGNYLGVYLLKEGTKGGWIQIWAREQLP